MLFRAEEVCFRADGIFIAEIRKGSMLPTTPAWTCSASSKAATLSCQRASACATICVLAGGQRRAFVPLGKGLLHRLDIESHALRLGKKGLRLFDLRLEVRKRRYRKAFEILRLVE